MFKSVAMTVQVFFGTTAHGYTYRHAKLTEST